MKTYSIVYYFLMALFVVPASIDSSHSCCQFPERGAQGPTGIKGPQGPTGEIGPTGPYGLGNSLSLTLDNTQTIADQSPVLFDALDDTQGNITYTPSTGIITLANAGYYKIRFGITASSNNRQFGIRINGTGPIPGSAIDTLSSEMQGLTLIFQTASANSTLEVFNNSGVSVELTTNTLSSASAYLCVQQIQ